MKVNGDSGFQARCLVNNKDCCLLIKKLQMIWNLVHKSGLYDTFMMSFLMLDNSGHHPLSFHCQEKSSIKCSSKILFLCLTEESHMWDIMRVSK